MFYLNIYKEHKVIGQLISWRQKLLRDDFNLEKDAILTFAELIALIVRNQNSNDQKTIICSHVEKIVDDLPYLNGGGGGDVIINTSSPKMCLTVRVLLYSREINFFFFFYFNEPFYFFLRFLCSKPFWVLFIQT